MCRMDGRINVANERRNTTQPTESIAMRLRSIMAEEAKIGRYAGEYADMACTLGDIEDRLYKKGEYAPENVGSTRGGAR